MSCHPLTFFRCRDIPSEEQTQKAIATLSNNKATGLDLLPAELFKILGEKAPNLITILTKGFNEILNGNAKDMIPPAWNASRMILLHKGDDKHDIVNYRPITLIQIIYKIFATILANRLTEFNESNGFPSNRQTGFRPERGTAQKLIAMKMAILQAIRNNSELHIISISEFAGYFPFR